MNERDERTGASRLAPNVSRKTSMKINRGAGGVALLEKVAISYRGGASKNYAVYFRCLGHILEPFSRIQAVFEGCLLRFDQNAGKCRRFFAGFRRFAEDRGRFWPFQPSSA
jgi:hypothetical protein